MRWFLAFATLLVLSSVPLCADDSPAALLKDIQIVGKQGTGSPAARVSWDKLVLRGRPMMIPILQAMDTPDTAVVNWLRTAFERIVETEGMPIDVDGLIGIAKDAKRQGRVRRLALETADRFKPGTSPQLIAGWLDDPEFRYEAVATLLQEADGLAKDEKKDQAIAAYRKAFAAVRDVPQAQTLTSRLKTLGVTVSIAEHLGFLTDWYVIGPFDAKAMKGFKSVYPPEEKIDLAAELAGKSGPLKWKRHLAKEAVTGLPARAVLVNLLEPLGRADDAVAYAYTVFRVAEAKEVEFRGAADDHFTVWVNGVKAFGFEEYRNGVRLDRHRFRVKLRPGENTVLVKIGQAPVDPTNNEPNWEFLLRVVDATGKGIARKNGLPKE